MKPSVTGAFDLILKSKNNMHKAYFILGKMIVLHSWPCPLRKSGMFSLILKIG